MILSRQKHHLDDDRSVSRWGMMAPFGRVAEVKLLRKTGATGCGFAAWVESWWWEGRGFGEGSPAKSLQNPHGRWVRSARKLDLTQFEGRSLQCQHFGELKLTWRRDLDITTFQT